MIRSAAGKTSDLRSAPARISHAFMNLYQSRPQPLHLHDDRTAKRLHAVDFVPWSSTT